LSNKKFDTQATKRSDEIKSKGRRMKTLGILFILLARVASSADIHVDPSEINFGSVYRSSFSVSREVQITNRSSESVDVRVGYDCGWDFRMTNPCPQIMTAGATCRVTFHFSPTVEGHQSCYAEVREQGHTQWIQLIGYGI
jgi:hypothetical protein